MLLSAGMLLRYSLQLETEATALEAAVEQVLADGARTADIAPRLSGGGRGDYISTTEFAQAVFDQL